MRYTTRRVDRIEENQRKGTLSSSLCHRSYTPKGTAPSGGCTLEQEHS